MDKISATHAKNSFAALVAKAAQGQRTAIERHGKVIAIVAPPTASAASPVEMRRLALDQQRLVELQRLSRHQGHAIRLLTASPAQFKGWLKQARATVDRWEKQGSCSQDFIEGWRALLRLPVARMASRMCGDLDGWGPAMRQNSPWSVVL